MDMSKRSDDQSPDNPLLPTLARGATIRFITPVKADRPSNRLQWDALPPDLTDSSDDFEFELDDDSYHDEPTVIVDPVTQGLGEADAFTSADTQAVDARAVLAQSAPAQRRQADPPANQPPPTRPGDAADAASAEATPAEAALRGARTGDLVGGKYLVEGQIGRGGMGRVLRARHQALGKPFALKLIKAPIATDPKIREMFYREAKLASSLSHENICSIVDFGIDERFGLFMVMELLEGQTLFHRIYHKGRFAPKVACDVIWQIAEALRYIHGQSIIHGDVKSENILLTRTPERRRVPKLLDFGLARASVNPEVGGIEGTPEYLAPERIYGGAPTQVSDIYALGLLFYELLAGGLPFRGSIEQVFRMQIEQQVPRVSVQLEGTIDERVDDIIARATAKDPGARHADVGGFMYELRTLMNMLGMPLPGRVRSRKLERFGPGWPHAQPLSDPAARQGAGRDLRARADSHGLGRHQQPRTHRQPGVLAVPRHGRAQRLGHACREPVRRDLSRPARRPEGSRHLAHHGQADHPPRRHWRRRGRGCGHPDAGAPPRHGHRGRNLHHPAPPRPRRRPLSPGLPGSSWPGYAVCQNQLPIATRGSVGGFGRRCVVLLAQRARTPTKHRAPVAAGPQVRRPGGASARTRSRFPSSHWEMTLDLQGASPRRCLREAHAAGDARS